MKKLIRYNDYENDPLSLGNACNGIAARCDLNKGKQFQLDDAIDAKVISGKMYYEKNMTFAAQVGPTVSRLSALNHLSTPFTNAGTCMKYDAARPATSFLVVSTNALGQAPSARWSPHRRLCV